MGGSEHLFLKDGRLFEEGFAGVSPSRSTPGGFFFLLLSDSPGGFVATTEELDHPPRKVAERMLVAAGFGFAVRICLSALTRGLRLT